MPNLSGPAYSTIQKAPSSTRPLLDLASEFSATEPIGTTTPLVWYSGSKAPNPSPSIRWLAAAAAVGRRLS